MQPICVITPRLRRCRPVSKIKVRNSRDKENLSAVHVKGGISIISNSIQANSNLRYSDVTKDNYTNSRLNIAHLNIRSLKNVIHRTEVKELIHLNKIDVLKISETWLNSTVPNEEITIEDYKILRLHRLHKKGGGVCAYIKKNIKATVRFKTTITNIRIEFPSTLVKSPK